MSVLKSAQNAPPSWDWGSTMKPAARLGIKAPQIGGAQGLQTQQFRMPGTTPIPGGPGGWESQAASMNATGFDTGGIGIDAGPGNTNLIGGGVDTPGKVGGWMDYGNMALGAAQVGLGVWNAYEQSKMNKFMKDYYGDQMDIARADFTNNAKSANETLAWRAKVRASAAGHAEGSDAMNQRVDTTMDKWGAQETV